ncbi:serine hydrolase [Caulobacter segnis]|uniref:Serine hydrolase n=1 Tax=Caulobacter segnis TaxID=88688 RepID=A0A2W5V2K8_9CAUL|nr:serine hydrolase domain-containing protein [Caulobacter segnis]PZR30936.1 MAG: serine hydrolase [Caulobacter segnis]
MRILLCLGLALSVVANFAEATPLTPGQKARIRAIIADARTKSPVPSTSVAIVVDGQLAYAEAFGLADLSTGRTATPDTRYDIGSVGKQFTAAAVMLLVQDGKLSLDDKVGRFLPELAGADKVKIRHLLSHTAGYRDYWSDAYDADEMNALISHQTLVSRWGVRPTAFEPGSAWDYSNTNYVIAGRLVEIASGRSLPEVLAERVFRPLGMRSAADSDGLPTSAMDAARYTRNLLGPARLANNPARGWAFAAGGLSMTASDLARWDASIIRRSLLAPASYDAMASETILTDGTGSRYGMGLYVDGATGHRRIYHNGFAPGVITENRIYPDDGVAVVVTANAEFGMVVPEIADGLEKLLISATFPKPATFGEPDPPKTTKAPSPLIRVYVDQLRNGRLDRRRLTRQASAYFSHEVLADYRDSLSRLGPPKRFVTLRQERQGNVKVSLFELAWPSQRVLGILRVRDDGKITELSLMAF